MAKSTSNIEVYIEIGKKRAFAGAIEWPGWCRMGRDESAALQLLFETAPRYARVLRRTRLGFQVPHDISAFIVVERLKGNATTDFGAPDVAPTRDTLPLLETELRRLQTVLKACWRALDLTVENAGGRTLRTGPRGGGRALDGILQHVLGSERSYLSSLGGKVSPTNAPDPSRDETRQIILETLVASAHGEIAERGPRGGKRWSPRYFVRRVAWHVLDHVWEIEDRTL